MAKVSKKKSPGSALLSRYKAATEASTRKDKPMGATTTTNRIPRKITSSSSFSSKVGRTVIRSHHTLQKRLAQALARNDIETARIVNAEIAALGGLESYQKASVSSVTFLLFLLIFQKTTMSAVIDQSCACGPKLG
jgi:25S rRNA (adenine2142-N1)-methyltransferase